MSSLTTCSAVCEEFTDTLIVDSKRNSILLNVSKDWFNILHSRLSNLGFVLIHKTEINEGYTCCYIKDKY